MANPFRIINALTNIENTIADFIANGPDTGIQGYVRDAYRHRCRELGNLPGWARALGVGRGPFTRVCQPYWDDNGWDGPVNPGPPFEGGQCNDVYLISITTTNGDGTTNPPFNRRARGPIGGGRIAQSGSTFRAEVFCSAFSLSLDSCGVLNSTGQGWYFTGAGGSNLEGGSVAIGIVQACGNDDCGDPPDAPLQPGPNPPPDPGPLPGPEPTDDPRDPTGLPRIPIPPYEDPIFGPTPIEEPEDSPAGGGPPSGGDGLPGAPDAVGPGAGGAEGGDDGEDVDLGEPPEGRVWVGVVVEATVDPRYGNIPGTGPENTVYPTTLGNASLIFEGYRGVNHQIRSKFSDFYRPVTSVILTGCRVSGLPGVDLTVKGISALTCPENPCEETDG